MRIVVTGTRGIPRIEGGVETHCENLYPLIQDECHEVIVVRRPLYARDKTTEYREVRIKDIAVPRSKYLEAFLHTLLSVLYAKKVKADIVHIHAIGPALLAPVAHWLGMKVVVTHHGEDYNRAKWGKVAKWMLRMGERCAAHHADHIIVISEPIKKLLYEKYPFYSNVSLIHNGISELQLHSANCDYINRLHLIDNGYILAVGRLVKEKEFDTLIKAFRQLSFTSLQLVIAGGVQKGEERYAELLKSLAGEDKRIHLLGFVDKSNLAQLYAHARLFVLPSSHEGLPIALLEAMSHKCQVLVSRIPANEEVCLPEDCYFECGNVQDLCRTMEKRLQSGTNERCSYDMSRYDWKQIAEATRNVYDIIMPRQ